MRAIETCYAGRRFRSRLEARWAVFLDAIGRPWDYEREGYRLPSGAYLPDFWLPHANPNGTGGVWLEIKGQEPTEREWAVLAELTLATGCPGVLLWGPPVPGEFRTDEVFWTPWVEGQPPFDPTPEGIRAAVLRGEHPDLVEAMDDPDNHLSDIPNRVLHFAACHQADCPSRYPVVYEEHGDEMPTSLLLVLRHELPPDPGDPADLRRVFAALRAASTARFEHGERPSTERRARR